MEARLSVLVEGVIDSARTVPLAASTIVYYARCCSVITKYCTVFSQKEYTDEIRMAFIAYQQKRLERGEIKSVFLSALTKTAGMLSEYQHTGKVEWRYRRKSHETLPQNLEESRKMFIQTLEGKLAPGTISLLDMTVRQVLYFLKTKKHSDFTKVSYGDVSRFLSKVYPKNRSNMGNVVWAVKRFFRFLHDNGFCGLNVSPMLRNPAPARRKVLPCFSDDEKSQILKAVDTNTSRGKRDYAIMQLAVSLGLRCCDIVNLRLGDINWHNNEILIVQRKTGIPVRLPLLTEAGNAVADYILNARPQTDEAHLFLRARRPYTKLSDTSPSGANLTRHYLKNAGIPHTAFDGKTFRAFRRTAGTRLIESGAELALTSQILGHTKPDSSKPYIALNEDALRHCCMPFEGYESTREGLG